MNRYRVKVDGRELVLTPGVYPIGRSSECKLVFVGALVSRRHARLVVTQDDVIVEDLNSRNGVRVNNERIEGRCVLQHGDDVGIGVESFTVIQEALLHRAEALSTLPPSRRISSVMAAAVPSEEETMNTMILDKLSKREHEVFGLIVQGLARREIAQQLFVSVKTVEAHRRAIGDKLGCRTRAELVSLAVVAGMLRPSAVPDSAS